MKKLTLLLFALFVINAATAKAEQYTLDCSTRWNVPATISIKNSTVQKIQIGESRFKATAQTKLYKNNSPVGGEEPFFEATHLSVSDSSFRSLVGNSMSLEIKAHDRSSVMLLVYNSINEGDWDICRLQPGSGKLIKKLESISRVKSIFDTNCTEGTYSSEGDKGYICQQGRWVEI